jgi:hypothetical protein
MSEIPTRKQLHAERAAELLNALAEKDNEVASLSEDQRLQMVVSGQMAKLNLDIERAGPCEVQGQRGQRVRLRHPDGVDREEVA